jgi:hypothetical protein
MNIIGKLREKITDYIDVYARLFKINLIGHTSKLLSHLMFGMICLLIFFCIILFTGFGLTEAFVEAGLSKMVSFFITIGVYVALLALVMAFHKNITRFFANGIIDVMTEGEEEDEGDKR